MSASLREIIGDPRFAMRPVVGVDERVMTADILWAAASDSADPSPWLKRGALLLTMLLGSLVAYALARYEFRGNRLIYYTFVAAMFFPVFLALVPLFFVVQQLGLLGTYQGLILVYAAYAVPFTVFFLLLKLEG